MDKVTKVFVGVAALAAIVLIGVGIGWFASRGPQSPVTPDPVSSPGSQKPSPTVQTTPPPRDGIPAATNAVAVRPTIPEPVVVPQVEPASTNWEDELDEILASDLDDTNKVVQLFAMFPRLDKEGQEEVAQHLSNLVEDENYAPMGQLLLDPTLSPEVLDFLMADVLNRPNAVKLPMFLGVARTPEHPNREEAMDMLELFLDEEYGNNWAAWQQKMEEWLKENPD